jgi:pimeloyl-ACP methyl ester carboxylesterase
MRARDPDRDGFADHDGVRVFYEVFGAGEPTLVLVPSNPIVHSRQWKAQVPYLSGHYRVVTFDGRGNGRSDRPEAPEAYTDEGWAKRNRHAWRRDYRGFVEFFFAEMFPEPHSTKQVEDCVAWGVETSVEAMLASMDARSELSRAQVEAICRRVQAPLLIVHGDDDRCQPLARAQRLAELTGAPLVVLEGAGHLPTARHPVKVNVLVREFVDQLTGRR